MSQPYLRTSAKGPLYFALPFAVILLTLLADQWLKSWVVANMFYGEERSVAGNWFLLHYTENNGIAFGLEFSGRLGKFLLTTFRLLASGAILFYLIWLLRRGTYIGYAICVALVFAGASGNIIDSIWYGVRYGYDTWLHGRVVDMLYFPLATGRYPDWVPVVGGNQYIFFRAVFNIADAAISVGVVLILIFFRQYLRAERDVEPLPESDASTLADAQQDAAEHHFPGQA